MIQKRLLISLFVGIVLFTILFVFILHEKEPDKVNIASIDQSKYLKMIKN
jgi:uncharacterized integral membrane protein